MHYKNNAKMTYRDLSGKSLRFSPAFGRVRSDDRRKEILGARKKMLLRFIAKMK